MHTKIEKTYRDISKIKSEDDFLDFLKKLYDPSIEDSPEFITVWNRYKALLTAEEVLSVAYKVSGSSLIIEEAIDIYLSKRKFLNATVTSELLSFAISRISFSKPMETLWNSLKNKSSLKTHCLLPLVSQDISKSVEAEAWELLKNYYVNNRSTITDIELVNKWSGTPQIRKEAKEIIGEHYAEKNKED